MRIAFVSANRETMPDAVIPLGLLYVMASIPERHEKELFDLCFEPEPLEFVEARLTGFQPDLVAIGLRNILREWLKPRTSLLNGLSWLIFAGLLVTGLRAVAAVVLS